MLLQLPPRTTPNGITEPETTPQWGLSLQIWSTPTNGPFQRRQVIIIVLLLLMMLMILLFYHVFNSIVVAIHLVRCFSVGSVFVVAAVVKFILLDCCSWTIDYWLLQHQVINIVLQLLLFHAIHHIVQGAYNTIW